MGVSRRKSEKATKEFKGGVARFARRQKAALKYFFRNSGPEESGKG